MHTGTNDTPPAALVDFHCSHGPTGPPSTALHVLPFVASIPPPRPGQRCNPPSTMWVVSVVIGVILRAAVSYSSVGDSLVGGERPEVTTPLSSYAAVLDAAHLAKVGIPPYGTDGNGDSVTALHQPPVVAAAVGAVEALAGLVGGDESSSSADAARRTGSAGLHEAIVTIVFIALDVMLAATLRHIAALTGPRVAGAAPGCALGTSAAPRAEEGRGVWEATSWAAQERVVAAPLSAARLGATVQGAWPDVVGAVVMLHPFAIASCAARTTSVFGQLALALAAMRAAQGELANRSPHSRLVPGKAALLTRTCDPAQATAQPPWRRSRSRSARARTTSLPYCRCCFCSHKQCPPRAQRGDPWWTCRCARCWSPPAAPC